MNIEQLNNIFNSIPQEEFSQMEKDCLYNMGVKHFQLKNFTKAISVFMLLMQKDCSNFLYIKALAGCLQAINDYASALFTYKCAYMLQPEENTDCLFFCGVCLYELDKFQDAKIEFNKYLENTISITDEMKNKANLYLKAIEKHIAEKNKS